MEDSTDSGVTAYGPTPSQITGSPYRAPLLQWTGNTGNTAKANEVSISSSVHIIRKQKKITNWFLKTIHKQSDINQVSKHASKNGDKSLQHLALIQSDFNTPTTGGATNKADSHKSVNKSTPGGTPELSFCHSLTVTSTPRKQGTLKRARSDQIDQIDQSSVNLTHSKDSTLTILLSLENENSLTSSPIRKKRRINTDSSIEDITSVSLISPNEPEIDFDSSHSKKYQFTKSNIVSNNSFQTHTTLPKQAESTWTNAKVAHLEGIRFSQRASFLRGAMDSNVLEDWSLQLDRLPSFLWKMSDFWTDYHKLRIRHARETMDMAAKYLEETATSSKRTAKALWEAATRLTKETLDEASATDILGKANAEWDSTTKRTIIHEHKILEERKEKLERKPISFSDVIDPMSKTNPNSSSSSNQSATRGGDFGKRG